jgi:hypothetical protein
MTETGSRAKYERLNAKAALTVALHKEDCHGTSPLEDDCNCDMRAAAILDALDNWTLVPKGPISVMVDMVTADNERMEAEITLLRDIAADNEAEIERLRTRIAQLDSGLRESAGARHAIGHAGQEITGDIIGFEDCMNAAIAAERARLAGSVMELEAVETLNRVEWNPDWISRKAVLALLDPA